MKNQDCINTARYLILEALREIRQIHFGQQEKFQIWQIEKHMEDAFALLDDNQTNKKRIKRLRPTLSDYVVDFVTEKLVQTNDPADRIQASILYQAYKDYCLAKGNKAVITLSAFGLKMNQIGIVKMKATECNYYICIRAKNDQDMVAEENDYYHSMGIAEI